MFRARTQRHIEQYHRGHRLELLMAQQAAALGGAMAEDEGDMPLALLDVSNGRGRGVWAGCLRGLMESWGGVRGTRLMRGGGENKM